MKTVLVATDFEEAADAALMYGRELARATHAALIVAHVFEGVEARGIGVAYFENPSDVQHDIEVVLSRRIEALFTEEDRRDLMTRAVVLESSDPADAIVNYATNVGVDLIVMGTHGRTGVSHLLMGSVAEKVVRHAPCPVLTVRQHAQAFVLPDSRPAGAHATHGGSS